MISIVTHKAPLNNSFTGVNTVCLGVAAGCLKQCGLKLYLYLAGNKDNFNWTLNPAAYANWLNIDYSSKGRSVRKAIDDGVADLVANGFLRQTGDSQYEFSEQIVPESN